METATAMGTAVIATVRAMPMPTVAPLFSIGLTRLTSIGNDETCTTTATAAGGSYGNSYGDSYGNGSPSLPYQLQRD
jgi:hypothetical protein